MTRTKTGLIAILALGSITTVTAIRADAENADPCGWLAYAAAAGLVAGGGYFFGAEEVVGIFTGVNAVYLTLDYLKIDCPSQTQIQSCDDSLGGCEDDTPGSGAGNQGQGQGQGQGNSGTDQGDDGSES